ncbi:MAG: hypothetical protein K9H26_10885 [Prolixibacteraceae bacterium]|nr:hypothetical protein [Prolixibacteraceae bacterium]
MKKIVIVLFVLAAIAGCKKENETPEPKRVIFSKITVTDWPDNKNGQSWDDLVNTEPDVYFTIKPSGAEKTQEYVFNNVIDNANGGNLVFLGISYEIEKVDFNKIFYFYLYDDDDFGDDEIMGYCSFKVEDYFAFPDNFLIVENDIAIVIEVTWIYE